MEEIKYYWRDSNDCREEINHCRSNLKECWKEKKWCWSVFDDCQREKLLKI
jgi:hypothetical protein